MNFLFDECLHTSLVAVARGLGHDASHVNWLGLSGMADWDLMPRIVADDFVFVTNNAQDFRRLYRDQPLHAGLVIFIPQCRPDQQRELLEAAIDALGQGPDPLLNQAMELDLEDDAIAIRLYALPG
ncbi:hypothetical protein KOAAANKH_02211 [Brevundimonas sp. NIBR10]|uniref:DUF5615 family PIN-like protein n=1 Tax=Brevundimonas sp. NIBR10 TaxID=3015997 RepID=UPI0022F180D5|nr:DUF5615 family PIN-like protein [Brevundimonas sp. NIBR10]WGM47336.1 hypothetical protein KOAAANKH_02211 [Brevundimonas sp. NIBR10]